MYVYIGGCRGPWYYRVSINSLLRSPLWQRVSINSFLSSPLWQRFAWLGLYLALGVFINIMTECDLEALFKGEGFKTRSDDKVIPFGEMLLGRGVLIGHMFFVMLLLLWTLVLWPFKCFANGYFRGAYERIFQGGEEEERGVKPNPQEEVRGEAEPLLDSGVGQTNTGEAVPKRGELFWLFSAVFILIGAFAAFHLAVRLPWHCAGI